MTTQAKEPIKEAPTVSVDLCHVVLHSSGIGGAQDGLDDLPWLTTELGVFDSESQCDPSLVSLVLHCHFKVVYE